MLKNLLLSTFLSLRANRLRVFLTMVGIIIGITAVVVISAIGEGMRRSSIEVADKSDSQVVRLIYKEKEESDVYFLDDSANGYTFTNLDLKMLRSIKGINSISADYGANSDGINVSFSFFDNSSNGLVEAHKKSMDEIAFGSTFSEEDLNENKIIIAYETMLTNFAIKNPRDILGKAIDIDNQKFQVIGIKKKISMNDKISDYSVLNNTIPKKAYNELAKNKDISAIKLKISDTANRSHIVTQANKRLKEYHPELVGNFIEDKTNEVMRKQMEKMIQSIVTGLVFITAISLLVGGIGVMNIMYVSVSERKREIGIRRAIGAKPINILMQFLLEAAFITLIGGIIGISLGFGIAKLISLLMPDIQAVVSFKMAIISAGISALIGIVFGIIPAINASRMDPIKAIYQ